MWHVLASFSLNLFKSCQAAAEGFIQVSVTDVIITWPLRHELKPTATICRLFKAIWSPNHLLLNWFFSSAVFPCNSILLIMICFCCVYFMGTFSLDVDLDLFSTADQTSSSYSRWWGKNLCFTCVLFCGFHAGSIPLRSHQQYIGETSINSQIFDSQESLKSQASTNLFYGCAHDRYFLFIRLLKWACDFCTMAWGAGLWLDSIEEQHCENRCLLQSTDLLRRLEKVSTTPADLFAHPSLESAVKSGGVWHHPLQ